MKVLFDASWLASFVPGTYMHGGLRVTYELAKRLSGSNEIDIDYTINNVKKADYGNLKLAITPRLNISYNQVVINNYLSLYYKLSNRLHTQWGLEYMERNFGILSIQQQNKYQLYHSPVDPIPAYIQKNKKIRPYLTALDLIALVNPEVAYEGFKEQLQSIYRSVDERTTVLAISQSTKNDLLNYRKDIKEDQVIVTYLGADKNIFFHDRENPNTQLVLSKYGIESNNYFFTLSALAKFKNTKHTIECFIQYTKANNNKDIKLLLVGKTREKNYDTEIYKSHKNNPQIIFLDFLPEDELSIIYSNSLAFIYMSLYEGFGLPILEAMQCGAPVICSNTSSMPEVIGDAGICIDPNDASILCESLNTIVNDSQKREGYIQRGLKRAAMFSWDKYAQDVINAYKRFY